MQGVERVACLAHCRRKFTDALQYAPAACRFIIKLIGTIYHFEKQCDALGLVPKVRALLRVQQLGMTLKLLKSVLDKLGAGRPSAELVKACKYMIGQWDDLVKILDLGHVKWDNNAVENAIRPTAVGKKNWLFVGDPNAGQRSAVLYSIILTCQHLGIQPLDYLRDVFTRLPQISSNKENIIPLLPHNWKASSITV